MIAKLSPLIVCAWLLLNSTWIQAQTGPGGIGNTDGSSNLELWLDANQVNDIIDGNNITTWSDRSGNGHDAAQSNVNLKPNWEDNQVNGMPAIRFDGNSERISGQLSSAADAPLTVISVAYFNQVNQAADDNDYVFSLGSVASQNNSINQARRRGNDVGNEDKFYSFDGAVSRFGPTITGQSWTILSSTHNSSSSFHSLFFDGTSQVVDDYTAAATTDGEYRIGDYRASATSEFLLEGHVAEVMVFTELLNTAEFNILHSYLGAKYNLAIANDQYAGDSNGNGDQDLDVAGVGTEADGSHTSSTAGGITVSQNSNFGTGDYLLFGHQTETNAINTADANDAGANLEARWERVWYFDVTDGGATATINLEFDFGDTGLGGMATGTSSNYKILYRASNSGNWTILSSASSSSGDQVSFSGISISADGYYTLGTIDETNSSLGTEELVVGSDGPGGVGSTDGSSSLNLWLNPHTIQGANNDPLLTIEDASGNGFHATQDNYLNIPTLQTEVVNGQTVVRFDGFNDYLSGDMSTLNSPATVIVAGYFANVNQPSGDNDYLVDVGVTGTTNQHCSVSRRQPDNLSDADKYYSWDGNNTRFGPTLTGQQWMVISQTQSSSSTFHQMYLDGNLESVDDYGNNMTTDGTYQIGRWVGNGNFLNGDVGEVIIYNEVLNTASLNIVHAYLGAKFGLSTANDTYAGDDAAQGDFDLDVAGVGTESDGSNTAATSAGIMVEQVSNFGQGDYAIFGHRVDSNSLNLSDISDAGNSLSARWDRVWYLDITDAGSAISVDITFDYSDADIVGFPDGTVSNYKLLYRNDTTGDWTILASASSVSGDQVTFSGTTLSNDGYYTIGTTTQSGSPLPVELLSFDAQLLATDNHTAVLTSWSTASEINNDYFTVERSQNGVDFRPLEVLKGAGNSQRLLHYSWTDLQPMEGSNYYRLRQTDFDGTSVLSAINRVDVKKAFTWEFFPNPANEHFTLRYSGGSPAQLQLIDQRGVLLNSREISAGSTVWHLDGLANGVYFLRLLHEQGILSKKLVVH